MLLKNGEIFNAKEPLQKLLAEKPPFAVSYGLAVLASKLDVQLGIIEKVRNGLVQTYGEKNPDNPQQIKVNPQSESFPKFVAEYNELMSKEIEIVLDVVEIPSTVELTVEPTVLLALLKFIKMVKK